MANEEHLKILKQGVEAWNEWRKTPFSILADLRGADLKGVRLDKMNLHGVFFEGANLHGADLYRADLSMAHFEGANLRQAHLPRVYSKRGASPKPRHTPAPRFGRPPLEPP